MNDLRHHLKAVQKIVVILNYPEDLSHEVRRGWPEIVLMLRGIRHYFATNTVSNSNEQAGLEEISRIFADQINRWLKLSHPPSRYEIDNFTALANEVTLHFERLLDEKFSEKYPEEVEDFKKPA